MSRLRSGCQEGGRTCACASADGCGVENEEVGAGDIDSR